MNEITNWAHRSFVQMVVMFSVYSIIQKHLKSRDTIQPIMSYAPPRLRQEAYIIEGLKPTEKTLRLNAIVARISEVYMPTTQRERSARK